MTGPEVRVRVNSLSGPSIVEIIDTHLGSNLWQTGGGGTTGVGRGPALPVDNTNFEVFIVEGAPTGNGAYYWTGTTWSFLSPPPCYHHDQVAPATVWNIGHGMNCRPGGILVQTTTGETVIGGRVNYVDNDNIQITYLNALAGSAELS